MDSDREMHSAVCSECGKECEVPFKPTEGKPVKCQDCFRKSRPRRSFGGGGFGGRRSSGFQREPRKMHKAVCAECGKECEVPFKPTEGKPVFCKECYAKKREDQVGNFD